VNKTYQLTPVKASLLCRECRLFKNFTIRRIDTRNFLILPSSNPAESDLSRVVSKTLLP